MSELRVLIVDDDEVDRLAASRALRGAASELVVGEASTVAEGIHLLGQAPYDCVVLDYRLPDGNAVTFLDGVRSGGEFTPIPVVVVTGAEDERAGIDSLQQGAQDYLFKSEMNRASLTRAVRYAIERHNLQTRLEERGRQLQQAQKMEAMGQLAGGIAHDFNNMLSVIMGFTSEALRRFEQGEVGAGGAEKVATDLRQVLRAADRSAELTRQILAFARKQVMRTKVLDASALVEGTRPLLERTLGEQIELTVEVGEPAFAALDRGQFQQVLVNLVINARDAMPEGGGLRVGVKAVELRAARGETPAGSYVCLAVTDTGLGMDAQTQAQVFQPFFTTKREGQGTGLGLAVVHGVVSQFGGTIHVTSEVGVGSTFEVYFPLAGAEAQRKTPSSKTHRRDAEGHVNTETILLVEDEDMVRQVLVEVLSAAGYRVLAASNGLDAQALSVAHPGQIDLLITDVVMPGQSGPELAELLQAQRRGLQVLFMSGYSDDRLNEVYCHEGQSFVQKPMAPTSMLELVRGVLDGHG